MIFVTIGTQMPFPRLLSAMDLWADSHSEQVIAQVGDDHGAYRNLQMVARLSGPDYRATLSEARMVVAHAGIGTILQCAYHKKPIIIMPRMAKYGEHRNNHQVDTASRLADLGSVVVVYDAPGVVRALESVSESTSRLTAPGAISVCCGQGGLPARVATWVHSQL